MKSELDDILDELAEKIYVLVKVTHEHPGQPYSVGKTYNLSKRMTGEDALAAWHATELPLDEPPIQSLYIAKYNHKEKIATEVYKNSGQLVKWTHNRKPSRGL